jgi:hypothetical protein
MVRSTSGDLGAQQWVLAEGGATALAASGRRINGEVEMSEWQSIETAPKDGEHILLFGALKRDVVTIGFWYEPERNWYGWYHPRAGMDGGLKPTHWMPLPAPPEAKP